MTKPRLQVTLGEHAHPHSPATVLAKSRTRARAKGKQVERDRYYARGDTGAGERVTGS